jgi:hypothetical protein
VTKKLIRKNFIMIGRKDFDGQRGFRARNADWGKHRTEVTEVTEGEPALWTRGFGGHRWLMGEKHADWGKHRTEVTEVTEGGTGVVDERVWWTSVADGRETRGLESIARRLRRSQRGIGVMGERLSVDTGALGEKHAKRRISGIKDR